MPDPDSPRVTHPRLFLFSDGSCHHLRLAVALAFLHLEQRAFGQATKVPLTESLRVGGTATDGVLGLLKPWARPPSGTFGEARHNGAKIFGEERCERGQASDDNTEPDFEMSDEADKTEPIGEVRLRGCLDGNLNSPAHDGDDSVEADVSKTIRVCLWQTNKSPRLNMPLMATFFLTGICRPHNGGIGKITIAVSMTIFTLTDVISSTVTLLQYPPGTGSQEYESG